MALTRLAPKGTGARSIRVTNYGDSDPNYEYRNY